MKSSALSTALLTICVAASAPTFAQHATKTPTAEVDQSPRSSEDLAWAPRKIHLNDSRLAGGPTDSLPENRVPLPSLCEMDPGHPSCDDDAGGGGGGGPDGGDLTQMLRCGFTGLDGIGFTEMMTMQGGICSQGGMYNSGVSKIRADWLNVGPMFYLQGDLPPSAIEWVSGCEGGISEDRKVCYGEAVLLTTVSHGPHWQAVVRVTPPNASRAITMSAEAWFGACGVVDGVQCQ